MLLCVTFLLDVQWFKSEKNLKSPHCAQFYLLLSPLTDCLQLNVIYFNKSHKVTQGIGKRWMDTVQKATKRKTDDT